MKLLTLLILFTLCSCSLSPSSPTTSGRSYGQGKMQAEAGNVNSTYNLKFGMGVSKDVDFGFVMEFGAISTSAIFVKYSFLNNETGPSALVEFGYGSADTTKTHYGGLAGSLAFTKEFELFSNIRINSVTTSDTDIEKDQFNGNLKILAYDITYLTLAAGMNVWFTPHTGLSLYSLYYRGEDIETVQDSTFGATFLFNF